MLLGQNNYRKTLTNAQHITVDTIQLPYTESLLYTDDDGYIQKIDDAIGYLKSNGFGSYQLTSIDIGDLSFGLNPQIVVVTDASGDLTNSAISTTVLGYISGLTSDVQVQITNDEYDISSNTSLIIINIGNIATNATNITTNASDIATNLINITNNTSNITTNTTNIATKHNIIDATNRLDASFIGSNGSVSNTEYGYLANVTSDIQTQIDSITESQWSVSSNIITPLNSSVNTVSIQRASGGHPVINLEGNTSGAGMIQFINTTTQASLYYSTISNALKIDTDVLNVDSSGTNFLYIDNLNKVMYINGAGTDPTFKLFADKGVYSRRMELVSTSAYASIDSYIRELRINSLSLENVGIRCNPTTDFEVSGSSIFQDDVTCNDTLTVNANVLTKNWNKLTANDFTNGVYTYRHAYNYYTYWDTQVQTWDCGISYPSTGNYYLQVSTTGYYRLSFSCMTIAAAGSSQNLFNVACRLVESVNSSTPNTTPGNSQWNNTSEANFENAMVYSGVFWGANDFNSTIYNAIRFGEIVYCLSTRFYAVIFSFKSDVSSNWNYDAGVGSNNGDTINIKNVILSIERMY